MSLPPITFATDTELRDAAFAAKLARRRRRLLQWSLPVVILAALFALKALSAVGLNLIGTSAYERANYSTAAARYVNTQTVNIIQPWKAFYNEGTAHYSAGKFFTAAQRLEDALALVPQAPEGEPRAVEECMVRVNYSLSLEGIADETLAVGDAAMAAHYYELALDMLADCAESGAGGEVAEDAQDRQEESLEDAQSELGEGEDSDGDGETGEPEDGDDEGSSDPSDGDDESNADPEEGNEEDGGGEDIDPRQQELEERNQAANEADQGDDGSLGGAGDGSGQNW